MVSTPLPDDMIEEVFHHLPIKSIFRFKCLSKKWLSKISDHRFACRYSSQGDGSWGLFFQQKSDVQIPLHFISSELEKPHTTRLSLDFLPHPIVYVVATSNDLVLCSPTVVYQMLYYVCNPITRKYVILPLSLKYESVSVSFSSLVDDYERGPTFTVVRAFRDRSTSHFFEIETFSSCSGEWTPPKEVSYPFFPRCFFLFKGTLYWLDHERQQIVAYDLAEDRGRSIALPGDRQNHHFNPMEGCVGVSNDQLRYMEISNTRFIFCVWVLENSEKGGWSLEHSIGFQSMVARNPPIRDEEPHHHRNQFLGDGIFPEYRWIVQEELLGDEIYIEPLVFHPLNQNIVVLRVQNRILFYNFANEKLENFLGLSRAQIGIYQSTVFPYLRTPWPTRIPTPSWKTPPAVVGDSSVVCSRRGQRPLGRPFRRLWLE